MGEIVEETKENNNKVVEITVKTIGPARPSRLSVSSPIKVHDLRKLIAKGNHLPIENLRLILHGKYWMTVKDEDDVYLRLCDGDSVIAALKLPDILLMAIFSLSLKMWAIIFLWFVFAPIAHRWDLGPLYILGTAFSIIFLNLGQRQPGDISAYSIFNDDFQELPGTLNADRLDRDIRAGQF
ncbi:ubiquitin family protein [Melia azedarach]|uniref:Ubiquitin family protein n=1 Tax=Melia azedarach TaxID=155640 RepID=A0ACC1YYA6_MELAZ|nr:ubiquitin family protein [Melia azedarach]